MHQVKIQKPLHINDKADKAAITNIHLEFYTQPAILANLQLTTHN